MSISTQSASPSGKSLAVSALRSAGLIDRDSMMRDGTDNAGGRKGRSRSRRLLDINVDRTSSPRMVIITTHYHFLLDRKGYCLLGPAAIPSPFPNQSAS